MDAVNASMAVLTAAVDWTADSIAEAATEDFAAAADSRLLLLVSLKIAAATTAPSRTGGGAVSVIPERNPEPKNPFEES
jgi:hypothetical protein